MHTIFKKISFALIALNAVILILAFINNDEGLGYFLLGTIPLSLISILFWFVFALVKNSNLEVIPENRWKRTTTRLFMSLYIILLFISYFLASDIYDATLSFVYLGIPPLLVVLSILYPHTQKRVEYQLAQLIIASIYIIAVYATVLIYFTLLIRRHGALGELSNFIVTFTICYYILAIPIMLISKKVTVKDLPK